MLSHRYWTRLVYTSLALATAVSAQLAFSIGEASPYQKIQGPKYEKKKIDIYHLPMNKNKTSSSQSERSFSLLRKGSLELDTVIASFLKDKASHLGIKLLPQKQRTAGFQLNGTNTKRFYDVSYQGIKFCHAQIKAFQFKNNRDPIIIGNLPEFHSHQFVDTQNWPLWGEALKQARDEMIMLGRTGTVYEKNSREKCLFVEDGEIIPVWRFTIIHNDLPYEAIASESNLYQLDSKFFHVAGTAKAYTKNPFFPNAQSPEISELSIPDFVGNGYLTNEAFTTDPVDVARTHRPNHQFHLNPSDEGFAEVNTFVHANQTLNWFKDLGYEHESTNLITIRTHYVFPGGDINNAVYSPSSQGARILIGDGGTDMGQVRLENLALDADVVSHEFAHHVIYQSITTTSEGSESLVLHEGLADLFTFLRTGDACLGESICPINSTFPCQERGACLRSAENNLKFTDPDLDPGAHLRSQFVSGMVWDLRKNGEIPPATLNRIMAKSLDLLIHDSGYLHLLLAMMTVDRELFEGQYSCAIYNAGINRGLGAALANFSCSDQNIPDINEDTSAPVSTELERSSGSTSSIGTSGSAKKKGLCGFIHLPAAGQFYLFLLIILAPIILPCWRRS